MDSKTKFEKLFSPCNIGKLQIKNRIVRPAAIMHYVDKEGFITDKHLAFYGALARGGTGLVIMGGCCIDYPMGWQDPGMIRIDDDKYIPGFVKIAEKVHQYNGKVFAQILHAGPSHPARFTDLTPTSSSIMPEGQVPGMAETSYFKGLRRRPPRELTVTEIKSIIGKFGDAAERIKKAGFDGIEVNGAAAHLLNSFMSRVWNHRQDEYGFANLENRSRMFVEVLQEVRNRVGPDYPITARFNGSEFGWEGCTKIDDARGFAKILEKAGADGIHVMAIGYGPPDAFVWHWNEQVFFPEPPEHLPEGLDWSRRGAGATIPIASAIKKEVSIPVMMVGRLNPELAEQILREGHADLIGIQRRLIADPDLPNKLMAGKTEDIAPCTACLQCLDMEIDVPCRINAALSGSEDYSIPSASKKKRVIVVGGGPAGLEAARVAAIRGHEVILYEKEPKLGGLLPLATMVKGADTEDLPALIRYLKTQVTKLGVKINLGQEFTISKISQLKPDAVILATGGKQTIPNIKGADSHIVVGGSELHHQLKTYLKFFSPNMLRWLTRFYMPLGKRVIIIGGDIQGCELAEFLVKRGRKVIIVETAEAIGDKLPMLKKGKLLWWLEKKGVVMLPGVRYNEITSKGLTITTKEGNMQTLEADTVVTSLPLSPETDLLNALKGKVPEVYVAGDCKNPRLIMTAIADGYHISRGL